MHELDFADSKVARAFSMLSKAPHDVRRQSVENCMRYGSITQKLVDGAKTFSASDLRLERIELTQKSKPNLKPAY